MIVGIAYHLENARWVREVRGVWVPVKIENGTYYVRWKTGHWVEAPHIKEAHENWYKDRFKYIQFI